MKVAVVSGQHLAPAVEALWPEATLVRPISSILGERFDRLVMRWRPEMERGDMARYEAQRWFDDALRCRLKPDGQMIWLC